MEGDIHDCLTLLQRSEDGRYSRRHSSAHATPRKDAPLPPHLYGQLAAHSNGIEMLATYSDIPILLQVSKYAIIEMQINTHKLFPAC